MKGVDQLMKAVRPGDRGPAVEDVQRRLLALGYDLGRTGVDGVFFGATTEAVRAFQAANSLPGDGTVLADTWSALVDASFTLGDRMLYLRLPHFHGHDVDILQEALNALGFACGAGDGIFGAYTERAVGEFQRNAGLPADGIVGSDTVRTITNLRHVWEGKGVSAHSAARIAPARAAEVLERIDIIVAGQDEGGRRIAARLVNLAHATTESARMSLLEDEGSLPAEGVVLRVYGSGTARAVTGLPLVQMGSPELLASRLLTAIEAASGRYEEVVVELEAASSHDEREDQRAAVLLLDAICAAFD